MARGHNEFLEGLKVEGGETSQIEIAEEAIKKELFKIIVDMDLENGQCVKMSRLVQLISENLGIAGNKKQIEQIITKLFQTDRYLHKINSDGDVVANYNKMYILQKQHEKNEREKAHQISRKFMR